ncbi:IS3 family transposase [Clostridium frigidicarnis]
MCKIKKCKTFDKLNKWIIILIIIYNYNLKEMTPVQYRHHLLSLS